MYPPSPLQDRTLLLPLEVSDESSERPNYLCKVIMKSAKSGAVTQIFQKLAQFINQLLDVIPFLCCHLLKPPHKYLINIGRLPQEGWDCSFNSRVYRQLISTGAKYQSNIKNWKIQLGFSAVLQHCQDSLLKNSLISALWAFAIT